MFIHAVLFEIKPDQVRDYRRDSKMWARYAKKAKGFIAYFTLRRDGYKNQYASIYEWKTQKSHERFMSKFHDWLVTKSKAKVKVLGYYNLNEVDKVR
jgi:hypothetical protein